MEYEVNIEEDTTIIEKFPSISRGLYIHDFQVTIDYITKYSNFYLCKIPIHNYFRSTKQ